MRKVVRRKIKGLMNIRSRVNERLKVLIFMSFLSVMAFTPTVLAQDLTDICGGGAGVIENVISPVIELGIMALIIYGFAALGADKMGMGDEGTKKAKWSVGTVVLIYVGYLVSYQIVQIDLSCLLPLV